MNIHTIEDTYQYRVHRIVKQLHREYKEDQGAGMMTFEAWLSFPSARQRAGDLLLDDIEVYCGLNGILENEY